MYPATETLHWMVHVCVAGLMVLMYPLIRDLYWARCVRVEFSFREWIQFHMLKAGNYGLPTACAWYACMLWNDFRLSPQSQMVIVGPGILMTIFYFYKRQSQWDARFRHYQRNRELTTDRLRRMGSGDNE